MSAAGDAVENFDGQSGDAEIGTDDSATPTIRAAQDAVENFDGSSGDAEIGADDGATPVIRAAARWQWKILAACLEMQKSELTIRRLQ